MSARRLRYLILALVVALGLVTAVVVTARDEERPVSGRTGACPSPQPNAKADAVGKEFMVAAANPLAADVGCAIIARGGNAVDAAIAVQAVLAVVEPHASGLAGGTVITYWDDDERTVRFFDGLATAPEAVTENLRTPTEQERQALKTDRFPGEASATGRAFGVPGTVRVLSDVHKLFGTLPWSRLFDDAIRLAADGFPMPRNLHKGLGERFNGRERCDYPDLRARYCDGDEPKPVGTTIRNAEIAEVLREVRDGGADAFYSPNGKIAPAIVDRAVKGPIKLKEDRRGPVVIPSLMTVDDFADYTVKERDRLCTDVFSLVVCSSAPPAFGGVAVLEMLGMLERGQVGKTEHDSPERVHLSIEVSRLANLDRRAYVGDPDYHDVPVAGLLNSAYLDKRFSLFSRDRAIHPIAAGNPEGVAPPGPSRTDVPATVDVGDPTSSVSIVDADGNAVSMTTTNNSHFGSHIEAAGMILNNAQNNFTDTASVSPGKPVNVMESRKRPTSAMAPTIVLNREAKNLEFVVGAAGGSHIPDYVTQTLVGLIVDRMGPAEALAQAHYSGQDITRRCRGVVGAPSELEAGRRSATRLPTLVLRNHPCPRVISLSSGSTAIDARGDQLLGAADQRRDGTAIGR